MQPTHDPSWNDYPQTVLELHLAGERVCIDLREPVAIGLAERLARIGPVPSFAIVTSDNPFGRERDDVANAQGRRELALALQEDGIIHQPADGISPDGLHRECGYAVWLDLAEARRLAREYGQSAFFWFDGSAFRIEGALVEAPPRRLPVDADLQA